MKKMRQGETLLGVLANPLAGWPEPQSRPGDVSNVSGREELALLTNWSLLREHSKANGTRGVIVAVRSVHRASLRREDVGGRSARRRGWRTGDDGCMAAKHRAADGGRAAALSIAASLTKLLGS